MSDSEESIEQVPVKKEKKKITDKQKAARIENLKKGRELRMKNLKKKKDQTEYDLDDSDDSDSSDDELLTSIMKPKAKKPKEEPKMDNDRIHKLESAFTKMIKLQKHQMKQIKKAGKNKTEKIVLLPPSAPAAAPSRPAKSNADALLDALKQGSW
jgi:hypothetical protein